MKILFVAGMAGWLISVTPAMSLGQGTTLGSRMPSVSPERMVRYEYVYTKYGDGATTYSGSVDLSIDSTALYYREYRGDREYREVLYDRNANKVLLFNHPQNRLNVFSELPHDAASFIPFPFQDEAIARVVELSPAQTLALSEGARIISKAGTLSTRMHSVPVQFRAELIPAVSGSKVKTFSIRAADGEVAGWTFTYEAKKDGPVLPTRIIRQTGSPFMTPEERGRYQRREVVPLTHWRPDARILYTFVADRPAEPVPTMESLFRTANEQTTIVDRRDLKNPISFRYRKEGGELERQIQTARAQGDSANTGNTLRRWLEAGGYLLLAPLVIGALCLFGVVWSTSRRSARSTKTQASG
ncbi:MAG: hypothetical protein H8F28_10990 [Fibrella sp.]|nr:hypothetical protein [Armatimonadota bacterium]